MDPDHYYALLRHDLSLFIKRSFMALWPTTRFLDNFHFDVIAAKLEDVRMGRCKRLIITLPPRSGKSVCASIAFPAFILGHDQHANIICASYARDLSDKLSAGRARP